MCSSGFRNQGLGRGVQDLGFKVQGVGFGFCVCWSLIHEWLINRSNRKLKKVEHVRLVKRL